MVRFFEITNPGQVRQNINTLVDGHPCIESEWTADGFVMRRGVVGVLAGTRQGSEGEMYFLRCGENTFVQIRRVGVSEISYSEFCMRYAANFEGQRSSSTDVPLFSALARLPILFNG